jgi:hypothetical protein
LKDGYKKSTGSFFALIGEPLTPNALNTTSGVSKKNKFLRFSPIKVSLKNPE